MVVLVWSVSLAGIFAFVETTGPSAAAGAGADKETSPSGFVIHGDATLNAKEGGIAVISRGDVKVIPAPEKPPK